MARKPGLDHFYKLNVLVRLGYDVITLFHLDKSFFAR